METLWMNQLRGKQAAVVVAHPDDEALFFGGLLSVWQGPPLTVICCCIPETEPLRALKFQEMCNYLDVPRLLLPVVETRGAPFMHLDMLDLSPYEIIFTHNEFGEYGHIHHRCVNKYVRRHAEGRIYVSGYGKPERSHPVVFDPFDKEKLIKFYNHPSALQKRPKYEELIDRWGKQFDLREERYRLLTPREL